MKLREVTVKKFKNILDSNLVKLRMILLACWEK